MGDICFRTVLLLHHWILSVCVLIHERRSFHNNQYIDVFLHPHSPKTESSNLSLALVPTETNQAGGYINGARSNTSFLHYSRNIPRLSAAVFCDDLHH